MNGQLKQSQTADHIVFYMKLSSDHITVATGLAPTVTLSKNGGNFAAASGAVTEIASGWYKLAGNATDTNTLGPLVVRATAATADNVDDLYQVVAYDPRDTVRLGLTALPNAAAAAAGGLWILGSNSTAAITIGALTTGAVATGAIATGAITATTIATSGTVTLNALTITNATTLSGAVSLGSTLGVTGTTTLAALTTGAVTHTTLTTSGLVTFNAFTVTGITTHTGATVHTGAVSYASTTTFTGAVSMAAGLAVTQSTVNGNAVTLTGNGVGAGLRANGGSIGPGFRTEGAQGMQVLTTGNGVALLLDSSSGNGQALYITADTGEAISINTNGIGVGVYSGTTGLKIVAATGTAVDITATSGTAAALTGSTYGLSLAGGSSALVVESDSDHAVIISTAGTNCDAIRLTPNGTGTGIRGNIVGNLTGNITGNLTGSIGSLNLGAITSDTFAADAISAFALSAAAASEIGTAVWATATRQLTGTQTFNNSGTLSRVTLVDTVITVTNLPNIGNGAYLVTGTVTDGTDPLQSVTVRVTSGLTTRSNISDASGNFQFALDAGTWTVSITEAGYDNFVTTRTVTGNEAGTFVTVDFELTAVLIPSAPSDPAKCLIYGYIRSRTGAVLSGVTVTATLLPREGAKLTSGGLIVGNSVSDVSNAGGLIELEVIQNDQITPGGTQWRIHCAEAHLNYTATFNGTTFDLATIVT